jgi:hypothetical protein
MFWYEYFILGVIALLLVGVVVLGIRDLLRKRAASSFPGTGAGGVGGTGGGSKPGPRRKQS